MKAKNLVACGIFAAVICIFSIVTIPIGTVPVTLSLFAVVLTSTILGAKRSVMATIVYILLGAIGLPVFSGFQSGFITLFGPTGGYIWSYIFVSLIVGISHNGSFLRAYASCALALAVSYLMGTLQFAFVQSVSFVNALYVCVIPFIFFDIVKIIVAVNLGITVKKRMSII